MKKKISTIGSLVCSVSLIIALVLSQYSSEIRTGKDGLELIGQAEGCRRQAYHCSAGILTDGIGNTHNVQTGKVLTDAEIARAWIRQIKIAETCVDRYAQGKELPQPVFEAVTSIVFNIGCTKMRQSTLFKYLNDARLKEACDEFPRWKYAQGKVLKGLEIRRQKEKALCLTGLSSS